VTVAASRESAPALRVREVVTAVVKQAIADRRAVRVALLDDGSPEADLVARWLSEALGAGGLVTVHLEDPGLESVLQLVRTVAGRGADRSGETPGGVLDTANEVRRLFARLVPGAVPANPVNKTALLLGGSLPPEPLLPLGDLYASEIQSLTGRWSAPQSVRSLAQACGGIERLDTALREYIDRRDPDGLAMLDARIRNEVLSALGAGRASRVSGLIVPKLGSRTLGADLFE
jgi:hypothetical protein